MRKINKRPETILSTEYKTWMDELEKQGKRHPKSTGYNKYYVDVIMNLLHCQKNVCAYSEICISDGAFTKEENWASGKFVTPAGFISNDHFGELEHFNPTLKEGQYWLWENLFMVHATINGNKSNKKVYGFLKPDAEDYLPEYYFDYNDITHTFIPNTDIKDPTTRSEIWYMINEVLYLNHGAIVKARKDYINDIEFRLKINLEVKPIDQFFTATEWTLHGKPDV